MAARESKAHQERDAWSLLVMGPFFVILAVLVLLGNFWAEEFDFAMGVNVVSGLFLLIVGCGLFALGRRLRDKAVRGGGSPHPGDTRPDDTRPGEAAGGGAPAEGRE